MAETKTATYKRYNGKDWDTIYFATSASQVGESSSRFFIKPGSNTVNGKQFTENGGITLYSTDIKLSSSDTTTVKDAIAQAMSAIPTGVLTTANYATTLDSVYEKKSDATSAHNTLTNKIDTLTTAVNNRYTKTESDNKYQPKGTYATLGTDGKVPSSQLPSYVDDVIEGYYSNGKFYSDSAKTKEITGEGGKIYTDLTSNKTYRWGGTAWVEISASLAIGETAGTAYDGKKGHDTNLLASQAMEKASAHDNTLIELEQNKADKATTLSGYGITDAYTKTEADGKYAGKSTTLAGYGITDAYTKTEADGKYVPYIGASKDVNLGNHSLLISDKTDYNGTMIKISGKAVSEDDVWTTIEPSLIHMQASVAGYHSYLYPEQLKIENGSAYSGVGVDGLKTAIHEGSIDKSYSWYKYDGIEHNGKKLTFPEKTGTIALLSDIPDVYTKTETDGKYQPKGDYASTTDLSHRATKIYFEDTVPTSGMVAGDICIEY